MKVGTKKKEVDSFGDQMLFDVERFLKLKKIFKDFLHVRNF